MPKAPKSTYKPKAPKERHAPSPPASEAGSSEGASDAPAPGPSAPSKKPYRTAPGTGKRRKVFSESLGVAHLLSLVSGINEEQEAKETQRLEKGKQSAEWSKKERQRREKERLAKKGKSVGGEKQEEVLTGGEGMKNKASRLLDAGWARRGGEMGVKPLPSKNAVRASLIAEQRAKVKARKEARKAAAKQNAASTVAQEAPKEAQTKAPSKRKRVSFA